MNEYAVYKGDKFVTIGTVEELSKELGVKQETVRFYATPSYRKRKKENGNHIIVIKIES
ncbi:MAG TPA: hypothetical protein VLA13_01475 [Massilibacterium sp.]|nr:hypothetical protein [Massilibacterium sp.]